MAKQVSMAVLERRRVRPMFDKALKRKNFMLPEQLVNVIERGCDEFDVTEGEFIRRLLFVYAIDQHAHGTLTQAMEIISRPAVLPELNPAEEQELRLERAQPEALPLMYGMLYAMDKTEPNTLHTITRNYAMEHVDEVLATIDRVTAKQARDAEQALEREAGAAAGP